MELMSFYKSIEIMIDFSLGKRSKLLQFFGVEIWFSNFRLRHFEKVCGIFGWFEPLDKIENRNTLNNSASFGANQNVLRQIVSEL